MRQTFSKRLATATRWPAGVALTSWRYIWRTTPWYRLEEPGSWPEDAPPPLPPGIEEDELQRVGDGAGPLFHRRYCVHIKDAEMLPHELVACLHENPDRASPSEFATFKKVVGQEGRMEVGDEYVVRMPGPWDGPVRVIEVTPTSFRLATLTSHLEAGQIRFGAEPGDSLTFTIESWARGGDGFSNLLYDRLRMSKEVQLHMWTSFLERVVKLSGGERDGGLELRTRKVEDFPGAAERTSPSDRGRRALEALRERTPSFEVGDAASRDAAHGWQLDDYRQPLGEERPGEPEPGGPWETAKQLMRDYEFADPKIIRATFEADSELEGRDILLEARFLGLRFHFGVRVGDVVDEEREVDGRPVRVWGWDYRTLQGHFETGKMDFEVWKWKDSGQVDFRIHAVSRPASISNPIIRLGFRIFGRGQQIRFGRNACERMRRLTAERVGEPATQAQAA